MSDILTKKFQGRVQKAEEVEPSKHWATGNIGLDWLMSGGIPQGRSIEFWGEESAGKTTTALECSRPFLENGYQVLIVDAERTVTKNDFQRLGLEGYEGLYQGRPNSGEEGIDMICSALDEGFALVIIDSVPALVPEGKEEKMEKDSNASSMGDESAMWSRNGSKIVKRLDMATIVKEDGQEDPANKPSVLFLNQARDNVSSPMGGKKTFGGRWLLHHFAVRVNLTLVRKAADKETAGRRVLYTINKNKEGDPSRTLEAQILPSGIDQYDLLIRFGKESGDIIQSGSHYKLSEAAASALNKNVKLGHGAKQVYATFEDDPDFYKALYNRIKESIND